MTYKQLTAQIAEAVKPNGKQAITGQVLQDVLLSIADYVKEGNDDIVSVIETSLTPTINNKVSQPTFDMFKEDIEARVTTNEDDIGNLSADIDQNAEAISANTTAISEEAERITRAYEQIAAMDRANDLRDDRLEELQEGLDYKEQATVVVYTDRPDGQSFTVDLLPDRFTIVDTAVTDLYVVDALASVSDGAFLAVLMSGFQFMVNDGDTPPTIHWPDTIRFPKEPTIESGYTYQVTVCNGLALITGWPNA